MRRLRDYLDRDSIHFQMIQLVVIVATAALFVSMIGETLIQWKNQQGQVRQSLATTTQAVSVAASAAIAFHDSRAANDALRLLIAQKEIEAAAVYPPEGHRLASYGDAARIPENIDQLREHLPSFGLFTPSTTLFQPIRLDDSTIGYIFIRASLRDYRKGFLLQAALAVGTNLIGLLLALWLGQRFLERIIKPVKNLAEVSRQVREKKNFALRAELATTDVRGSEVGELVASFNAMLAEIEQRQRELASYHNNLERMVRERTQALHEANRDLLAAKEAAEAASRSKSRFLAAASHDLRQPIQAINLFQTALSRTEMSEEQKRISHYLGRSILSLGDLLSTLLDISKLDAGAITPKQEVVSVHDLASGIDDEFSAIAAAKSLRFKLHFPFGEMALFTDHKLLQGLLRNLIGNAIKYTNRGGVLVAIRRRGDHAIIQVWDTGIGIAPEHLDAIFDEYFQVGNYERDNTKGLGLGLSIVKRLARLLETRIACRSRLGHGSVFEFRLPLADPWRTSETCPLERETSQEAVPPWSVGRHVVVIDDDAMVAKAMQVSLESHGMRVTIHGSAEAALADSEITRADYYVSDFRLPGASGIQLLDAIQQRTEKRIKAVLLTGETSPDRIEAAQSARWTVLFKPVALTKLLSAFEQQDAMN